MKPLFVLLGTFLVSLVIVKLTGGRYDPAFAGRIAMSVMLLFTAVSHFVLTKGMVMMIPTFFPFKKFLIYLTGIIEVMAAAGLHIPALQKLTAWMLILFFVLILPANINAAIKKVDFQKATHEGNGTTYLWFRIPLQILFIIWTYFCAILL